MKRFASIRFILILAFTLSLLIPIVAMMLYGSLITSRVITNRALERRQHEVTLQAQHIQQSLEHVRDDGRYLASLRTFRHMQTDNSAMLEAEQDFIVFAAANPMYFRILYLSDSGTSFGVDNSNPTPRIMADDVMQTEPYQLDYQQFSSMQVTQVAMSFDLVWDTPVLRYRLRVDNGILILDVLASWVLRNMPGVEANNIWAILHSNGQHLLFPMRSETFADAIPATDTALNPYLADFQSGESGTFNTEKSTFIYSRVYPTSDTNSYWLLYRQIPQSEIFAAVDGFYRTSLVVIGIAVVTAFGLAVFIGGQIIRPLIDLKRKARDFANGLPVAAPQKTWRLTELSELHSSFHDMADQLENERQANRRLIKQLISAQEDERKRVAYDLHDGLIQQLVGAKMYISMLKSECDKSQLAMIESSEQTVTQAIVEGRRMIEGLHPTILDDLGLVDALAELGQQEAKRYGWQLNLQLETLPYTPDKTVAVTIFRIVQEALNNVGKHAQASHVTISLSNGDIVRLSIEDDGCGFNPETLVERAGIGLGAMRERAGLLGGTCKITSTPDRGTKVMIELPYD